LKLRVFFSESLDAPGGVHQFLFAGEKRMTFGAYFHPDIGLGRSGFENSPACALDGRLFVIRMNVGFHFYKLL
jgi:hypothetical protein